MSFYFLRAYASWSHQSMTGLPIFGPSKEYKVALLVFCRSPHQSPRRIAHSKDMAEPAQPLDINTLHNVYVVEELIQLTVGSDMAIIANSHWTEDFF